MRVVEQMLSGLFTGACHRKTVCLECTGTAQDTEYDVKNCATISRQERGRYLAAVCCGTARVMLGWSSVDTPVPSIRGLVRQHGGGRVVCGGSDDGHY